MNKKVLLGLGAVAVVSVGAFVCSKVIKNKKGETSTEETETTETQEEVEVVEEDIETVTEVEVTDDSEDVDSVLSNTIKDLFRKEIIPEIFDILDLAANLEKEDLEAIDVELEEINDLYLRGVIDPYSYEQKLSLLINKINEMIEENKGKESEVDGEQTKEQ